MPIELLVVEEEARHPDDLRQEVRSYANRKVARLLTPATTSAFVASLRALRAVGDLPRTAVGLYTASAWEGPSGESAVVSSNPTDFLRSMANAPLCQIAVASGIQGPNTHFVGGVEAVWGAVQMAEGNFRLGEAQAVVVTAFDVDGAGHARATAALFGPSAGQTAVEVTLSPGRSALDAVASIVAAATTLDAPTDAPDDAPPVAGRPARRAVGVRLDRAAVAERA